MVSSKFLSSESAVQLRNKNEPIAKRAIMIYCHSVSQCNGNDSGLSITGRQYLDPSSHDSLVVEDGGGGGPSHVVVLSQPARPHTKPWLETARSCLWCPASGRERALPGQRTAGGAFHLLPRSVLVVWILLNRQVTLCQSPSSPSTFWCSCLSLSASSTKGFLASSSKAFRLKCRW